MHRAQLLSLLHSYHSTYPEELAYKKEIIEFIEQYPDCFERSLAVGHITASAWLLSADYSQALLMHHTKLDLWVQFGGHCDGDSDVLRVAIKEAQEESGIQAIVPVSTTIFDIDVHRIPARKMEPAHTHYDIRFLLAVVDDVSFCKNQESQELRWIGKKREELPTDSQSMIRMFTKWVQVSFLP